MCGEFYYIKTILILINTMINIRPINHGNHNNIHYIVKKNKKVLFKTVCFLNTEEVYIVKSTMRIKTIDNLSNIYNTISLKFREMGFELKTSLDDINLRFNNTTELMEYYNIDLNEI